MAAFAVLVSAILAFIFCCLVTVEASVINATTPRIRPIIVGGQVAREGQYPFMALLLRNGGATCGGAILSARFVLTAAHCVHDNGGRGARYPPSSLSVRVGSNRISSGGVVIPVAEIRSHPNYRFIVNDAAILRLARPIQFNARTQFIQLSPAVIQPGTRAVVPAWGVQRNGGPMSDQLRFLTMTSISDDECFRAFQPRHPAVMCYGTPAGQGMCRGDSGSPMVWNRRLVGISSFGQQQCGTAAPDGFARVSVLYQWIQQNSR